MKDILLETDGDLSITAHGDIRLTDSVRQAVRIRLLWFLNEWKFAPQYGVPYFEAILVKNPNLERIRGIVKSEIQSATEVQEVRNVKVAHDKATRKAKIQYELVTNEGTFGDEVEIIA